MTARWYTCDVFDGLAQIPDESVDLVITSPPFLALRSYLPADHPDKAKEIGSEATPAEFIDVMLAVTKELRRVLAPHGSLCVELGDTYAGSGGGGGDYLENGWREGQQQFAGSGASMRESNAAHWRQKNQNKDAWPLAKSKTLIPQLYEIALAYGFNPLTGQESPAGRWRIRNVVTWARPNPPVGALGDKWRPATSDVVVACTSDKRYWDDLATRKPHVKDVDISTWMRQDTGSRNDDGLGYTSQPNPAGAPLLDYWEIPPTGYSGAHYAVYPPALVEPLIKAMCPQKVCRECGEPSRRIVENNGYERDGQPVEDLDPWPWGGNETGRRGDRKSNDGGITARLETTGFTDCGHDAIGIDLDERNAELARERIGPFFFEDLTPAATTT